MFCYLVAVAWEATSASDRLARAASAKHRTPYQCRTSAGPTTVEDILYHPQSLHSHAASGLTTQRQFENERARLQTR